jgi:hypothetical protein
MQESSMPKSKKQNNLSCCLVSILLWPIKLLESLINEIIGKPTLPTPASRRRAIPNVPQHQNQIQGYPYPQIQNQSQTPRQQVGNSVSKPIQIQPQIRSQEERFAEVIPVGTSCVAQPSIGIAITYEDSRSIFLKDAQKFKSVEGDIASPATFVHYWPTYRDMNPMQQRWYFYWRTQARRGNYLPTDLSYIFVHIYEILNLVEISDPVQAADRIRALWQAYRKTYAKLDRFLPEWGGDLLALKANGTYALAWWESLIDVEGLALPDPVLNVIVEKAIRTNGTDKLPYKIWALLSDYQPRNKFYQAHNINHQIDVAYEKAIKVANSFYFRTSHKSLIDQFVSDQIYPYEKNAFTSALIARSDQKVIRLASGRDYAGSAQLSNAITSIMKYAENLLRKQLKFSAKLSGVELHEKLAKELDKAFLPAKPEPKSIKITLDSSRVATLQKESQEVSTMLATEADNKEKPLLTDLAKVRSLWTELNSLERQIITRITLRDLKSVDALEQLLALQAVNANNIIESINSKSLVGLGDRLIYVYGQSLSLAEDFLDELDVVVRETPDENDAASNNGGIAPSSWPRVFDHLDPAEVEVLKLLAQKGSLYEAEIDSITRNYDMIGSVVLDSLNEKAQKCLDHLPIFLNGEEWYIEEEDLPILRKYLGLEVI